MKNFGKKIILYVIFLNFIPFARAQNTSSEYLIRYTTGVAGSSENISSNNKTYVVQQSIGQASVIATFYGKNYVLRQGFIQPYTELDLFPLKPSPLNPLALNLAVAIYPNPFTETVTLSFSEEIDDIIEVLVFNMVGRLVFSENYAANRKVRVQFPNISLATYIIRITANNQLFIRKIIKK